MKQIKIDISEDGEIRIETTGFKGRSCLEEAEFLKAVLGREIFRQLTPAYWGSTKVSIKKYLNLCG